MKVCVLIPNKEYATQAGVRIRYQRIFSVVGLEGINLSVIPIQDITAVSDLDSDIYIISKCYDARAIYLANLLKGKKCVGVDIFDDYFSQIDDSRFTRLRLWLSELATVVDFAMCATPAMISVIRKYNSSLPVHVLNDPAPIGWDDVNIRKTLAAKLVYARKEKTIKLGWFGMGDNPNFPVGLRDLAAFSDDLLLLKGRGYHVDLSVLTNARAMTPDNLKRLARLPVDYRMDIWSEEKEQELLEDSLICFLPVNAQNFSIMKSLNRGITALVSGTQILSAGFPLYEPLSRFVYKDAIKFITDLDSGKLLLCEERLMEFDALIREVACSEREGEKFTLFLQNRAETNSGVVEKDEFIAVLHGMQTVGDVHKFAQRLGGLSISTPFCQTNLNFDIRFEIDKESKELEMLIAEKKLQLLPDELRNKAVPCGRIIDRNYYKVLKIYNAADTPLIRTGSVFTNVACYNEVIATLKSVMESTFPGIKIACSELSKSAWWIDVNRPSTGAKV